MVDIQQLLLSCQIGICTIATGVNMLYIFNITTQQKINRLGKKTKHHKHMCILVRRIMAYFPIAHRCSSEYISVNDKLLNLMCYTVS